MYERQETSYCGDTNFIIMETREAAIRPSRDLGSWEPRLQHLWSGGLVNQCYHERADHSDH